MDFIPDTPSVLKSIRHESTDIYNRLHSIHEDSQFVTSVAQQLSEYPLFGAFELCFPSFIRRLIFESANQRCGAWYIPTETARPEFVYFKSTDGHFGQWSFNLRRANLHLLPLIQQYEGIILVDSTRGGKSLPDSLSKTVPMWCAVINEALKRKGSLSSDTWEMHGKLVSPPRSVSETEHYQMLALVSDMAAKLLNSSFELPPLRRPLRPFWVTPRSGVPSLFKSKSEFFPVICVSASKQVADGLERRAQGFTYIQGSGDDHESWSMGLTSDLYWRNENELLSCGRDDLADLVERIASLPLSHSAKEGGIIEEIKAVQGNICFMVGSQATAGVIEQFDAVITLKSASNVEKEPAKEKNEEDHSWITFEIVQGKKGQMHYLHHILPNAEAFGRRWFDESGNRMLVIDEEGSYDSSIGVLMLLLALFFDDTGNESAAQSSLPLTKNLLRTRLEWIQQSIPRANPSRTTMKRVNEHAISRSLPVHRLNRRVDTD